MRKCVILALSLFLAIGCLAGCSPSENNGKIELHFMGWGGSDEKKAYDAISRSFMAENPNVRIKYETVPPTQYATKLQNVLKGSNPPDIFYLPGDSVTRYVLADKVEDLTPYFNQSPIDKSNLWNEGGLRPYRFHPETLARGGDGDPLWALPKDVGPFAMFYNKDLFQKSGVQAVDYENPWTWEEFLTEMRKIPNGSGAGKTFALANFEPEMHLGSNNAKWLSDDKRKSIIAEGKNGERFAESIQFLSDIITSGLMPTPTDMGSQTASDYFTAGKAGIYCTGPWAVMGFKNLAFDWDLMPIPKGRDGTQSTWRGSMGLALSKNGKNKGLAYRFAEYLAFHEEGQRNLYQMGQTMPNLKDMANGEYAASETKPVHKTEFMKILNDESGYCYASPAEFTYDREWYEIFFSGWIDVLEGRESAGAYCADVVTRMQASLDKAWEKAELAQLQYFK